MSVEEGVYSYNGVQWLLLDRCFLTRRRTQGTIEHILKGAMIILGGLLHLSPSSIRIYVANQPQDIVRILAQTRAESMLIFRKSGLTFFCTTSRCLSHARRFCSERIN